MKKKGGNEVVYFFSIGPTKYPTIAPIIRAAIAYICQLLAELCAAARSASRSVTSPSREVT